MKWPRLTVPPEYKHYVQQAQQVVHRADSALSILWRARDGGPVDKALAAVALAGEIIRLFDEGATTHEALLHMGYERIETSTGEFLCSLIRGAPGVQQEIMKQDEFTSIVFWSLPEAPRAVAAIYENDDFSDGPYTLAGLAQHLKDTIRTTAWRRHNDLELVPRSTLSAPRPRDPYGRRGRVSPKARTLQPDADYRLQPMSPVHAYIGKPRTEWYAERMSHYAGDNRIIRLIGPSGVGKSTLARILGRAMAGEDARTLKISSAALVAMPISDVVDLADYLTPDVLVLDDLESDRWNADANQLAFLEALHSRVPLTVLTFMSDDGKPDSHDDMTIGLRPGRIDETFCLETPNERDRRLLIDHFCGGEEGRAALGLTEDMIADMAERTRGFTGAYLQELVLRLQRHGTKHYKSEVARLTGEIVLPKRRRRRDRRTTLKIRPGKPHFDSKGNPLWDNWTKAHLVAFCRHRAGVSATGRVAELRERLATWWEGLSLDARALAVLGAGLEGKAASQTLKDAASLASANSEGSTPTDTSEEAT